MKQYVFCLIFLFSLSCATHTNNMEALMAKVSKTENVDKVKVGGLLLSLGKKIGGVDDIPVVNGLKGVEVFDLSRCSDRQKKNLKNDFSKVEDKDGYETLLRAKDEGDDVRIMIKKNNNKDIIKEMIILAMNGENPAIVRIYGDIKEDDIDQLINQYSK